MKNSIKRKVLVVFSTILLAMICSLICMNLPMTKAYAAGTAFTEPQGVIVAAKDAGFAVTDGASVRVSTAGIKFTTTVTEGYHKTISNDGTNKVTYFAVARKAGGASQRINFAATPDFSVNKYHEYNTYLNFDAYQEANKDNAELLAAAYATEFEIDTYAEVTTSTGTTYYKAYQAEDNSRSMRVVANAAQLKGEDANALAQYYTAQDRTTDEMAYVDANGNGKLVLPKLSGGETYVGAYVGTKNVTDAVVDNEISLSNIDVTDMTSGSTKDVSAFTSTGRVISRKMAFADTVIKAGNVADLLSVTGGYVVIAEDIDMATAYGSSWAATSNFSGVLNGLEHEISNLNSSTGLFASFGAINYGGTIKNLAIVNATITGQSGALAKSTVSGIQTVFPLVIDNVFVSHAKQPAWGGGGMFGRSVRCAGTVINVNNSYVYINSTTNGGQGLFACETNASITELTFTNSYFVGIDGKMNFQGNTNITPEINGDYHNYSSVATFIDDYLAGKVTGLSDFVNENVNKSNAIKEINSSNISDLLTATSGVYMITEDIDMSKAYTANEGVWASAVSFNGVLVGGNHTITNFKTSTGLFQKVGGTIKNLAILDASCSGEGILAKEACANLTVDNVIFTLAENTSASWYGTTPLFGNYRSTNVYEVNVNNSLLWNKTNFGTVCAVMHYHPAPVININNSYIVGTGSEILYHSCTVHSEGQSAHLAGEYSKFANFAALEAAYAEGKVTNVSDLVKNYIIDNSSTLINSKNISKLLTATSGTYYITEDIDMATAYTDNNGVWASTTTFNGTIEGLEHKITNFKTTTGLFRNFGGTVNDLAIVDAQTIRVDTNGRVGVLATVAGVANVTINNSLISATVQNTDYYAGTIFGEAAAVTIAINDSVIYNKSNASALVGYLSNAGTIIVVDEDSYVIAKRIEATRVQPGIVESDITTINGVTATTIEEVNYTGNLSEFIEGILGF